MKPSSTTQARVQQPIAPPSRLRGAGAALIVAGLLVAPAHAEAPDSEEGKVLYFIGMSVARNLADFQLAPNEQEIVVRAIRETLSGSASELDQAKYGRSAQDLLVARRAVAVEAEKKAALAFLEKARSDPGAERLDSGLVFTKIEEGSGKKPGENDRVRVHYEGKLRDGTVFDSSIQRGQPAEFRLSGVIKCWQEGVQMLKEGGRARLVCPPEIAYGDRGAPPRIPGGAALSFDVELLAVIE